MADARPILTDCDVLWIPESGIFAAPLATVFDRVKGPAGPVELIPASVRVHAGELAKPVVFAMTGVAMDVFADGSKRTALWEYRNHKSKTSLFLLGDFREEGDGH